MVATGYRQPDSGYQAAVVDIITQMGNGYQLHCLRLVTLHQQEIGLDPQEDITNLVGGLKALEGDSIQAQASGYPRRSQSQLLIIQMVIIRRQVIGLQALEEDSIHHKTVNGVKEQFLVATMHLQVNGLLFQKEDIFVQKQMSGSLFLMSLLVTIHPKESGLIQQEDSGLELTDGLKASEMVTTHTTENGSQ